MKSAEVVKSIQEMFSDKHAELLDVVNAAKLKQSEEVLLAELDAMEDDSKLVELAQKMALEQESHEQLVIDAQEDQMLELAKKLSLEEGAAVVEKIAEVVKEEVKIIEDDEEEKHEAEVEKAEPVHEKPSEDIPKSKLQPPEYYAALLPEIKIIQ